MREKEEIGCVANRDKRNSPEKSVAQGENFPNVEAVFSITYSETLGWVKVLGYFGKVTED